MAKVATDFEKIIHSDRSRKKNTALAAKIFGKDRRASAPAKAIGALTARAGVQKRVSSSSATPRAGNINTEWTHDLHNTGGKTSMRKNNNGSIKSKSGSSVAATSLASRVSRVGESTRGKQARGAAVGVVTQPIASTRGRQQRRAAQVANALDRAELDRAELDRAEWDRAERERAEVQQRQTSYADQSSPTNLSIRGVAAAASEPLVVMAQNFAPGTTAADIESVMTPVGGLVSNCRILKQTPLVIAEILFESREGAERVIKTFNNRTADGRVLYVYPKTVNGSTSGGVLMPHDDNTMPGLYASMSRPKMQGHVIDGSLGFDDPMDADGFGGQLYSDDLIGSQHIPMSSYTSRRGRSRGGRR
ncbi:hypothetical protein SEPCBS57363_002732 [Sporothrix epigloea]|uniref:RRM domain-containing protein n=1 Tax=Sporothrix epigloea TaxID=1892477 RepID=A0ABP0DJA3_9PEZI